MNEDVSIRIHKNEYGDSFSQFVTIIMQKGIPQLRENSWTIYMGVKNEKIAKKSIHDGRI